MRFFLGLVFASLTLTSWSQEANSPVSVPKEYSKVWLIGEFNLNGFTWQDLGLDRSASFTTPVLNAWKNFLETNMPSNAEGIGLCDENCADFMAGWQEQEENPKPLPEVYNRGVWLRVSFNLKKLPTSDPAESSFQWEGRIALLDITGHRLLGSHALGPETHVWRNLDRKNLNSALASQMYRSPLPGFKDLKLSLEKSVRLSQNITLTIEGHKNVGDLYALMDLIKSRGKHLGMQVSLESFKSGGAKLICMFRGEEKAFSDLLSQLKELKSSHSYGLTGEFIQAPFVLRLVSE